jgi:hypothetical protein
MNTVYFTVGVLLIGLVSLAFLGVYLVRSWGQPLLKAVVEGSQSIRWEATEDRLEAIERDLERLPRVWEEFADDARKTSQRAGWHVKRITKELAERGLQDDEIDALGSSLRPIDESGGNGSGMQSLQAPVEEIPAPAPEESWREKALRRKWGHG